MADKEPDNKQIMVDFSTRCEQCYEEFKSDERAVLQVKSATPSKVRFVIVHERDCNA